MDLWIFVNSLQLILILFFTSCCCMHSKILFVFPSFYSVLLVRLYFHFPPLSVIPLASFCLFSLLVLFFSPWRYSQITLEMQVAFLMSFLEKEKEITTVALRAVYGNPLTCLRTNAFSWMLEYVFVGREKCKL